ARGRLGFELEIGSVPPPLTSLRHEHITCLRATIHYAPPQEILKISEKSAKTDGKWPLNLIDRHERKYGASVKAEQRARNALYFADHFKRRGVDHVHVHFANRAAHAAMFLKEISGISFSVTAHGQDFMKDLGNDDLLREICAAAEFVAAETDYSRDLLRQRCPESAAKIHRVYNGMDLTRFSPPNEEVSINQVPRIISIGRLVAFKGFEYLIDACADLARRIPESVVDGETGLLVPPADTMALAQALGRLMEDAKLRLHYGRAGRARIEQHFRIEHTVESLIELLHKTPGAYRGKAAHPTSVVTTTYGKASRGATKEESQIAYIIEHWPDRDLPLLEREIEEMKRRHVPIVPIVSELNSRARYTRAMEKMASSLEFLPDPMVIESEWRANHALAQKLEEDRAQQSVRAPSAIFLRQARFALVLINLLRERKVSHVHATSSRALACALILKKLLNVTVSATIEARPALPREWIQNALSECAGGRLRDRQLVRGSSFLVDKTTFRSAPQQALGLISQRSGIDLTAGTRFWQEWADLLTRWSGSDRESKIKNRK